jgi:hypothetical protein
MVTGQLKLRPSVSDLTFQVYDAPIHPEFISSLCTRTFERDGYRLRVHLTAAGHMLEWHGKRTTIVELLTDQSTPLPEQHQLFCHRIGPERSEQFRPSASICYLTCFQVERMVAEVFFHYQDELRRDAQKTGLLYVLRPHDRLGLSPLSYMDLQARSDSLVIHTYHTFPDEYAVVKVQTLVEVRPPG